MKKPVASDIAGIPEVEILQQLRDTPKLLHAIQVATGSEMSLQNRLRETYSPELVRSAFRLLEVREKAEDLLPEASSLWLTKTGLEQSTPMSVAKRKAERFPAEVSVMDLCSGLGIDTNALLQRGAVHSVDIDPAMVMRNEWNNRIWSPDLAVESLQQSTIDVTTLDLSGKYVHVDPDRRSGLPRPTKRLEKYQPDLAWMQQLIATAEGGAIKLGPASNFMQKFPNTEIELVSLNGECKEATVWFGALSSSNSFRATLLPSGETITGDPLSAYCPPCDEPQNYIFDPDPAVVRSGLLDHVGEMHSLCRLDSADEYLTGQEIPDTGFVTAFRVEVVLPNNPRELKRYLAKNPSRDYQLKCRHLKVNASELQRKLPRGDGPIRVVIFLRVNGKARIVVCERIQIAEKS